jgi:hypothetical protein
MSLAHREDSALMEINTSALWDSIKTRVCFKREAGLFTGFLLVFENQCEKLRGRRGWPLRFSFPSSLRPWGREGPGMGGVRGFVAPLFLASLFACPRVYHAMPTVSRFRLICFFRCIYLGYALFIAIFSSFVCSFISIFVGDFSVLINT